MGILFARHSKKPDESYEKIIIFDFLIIFLKLVEGFINFNDVSKFSNKLFETSKLKFYLGNLLMEHYFSSRKVNKILKQKINTVPFNDKKEEYELKQLLKKVKNKSSLNEI